MRGAAWRSKHLTVGLPFKFILPISLLIILTSVTLGWFFGRHDVDLITLALMDRGKSLARSLAANLGYELQYGTEERLNEFVDSVVKQEDVLYVMILDEKGRIRAQAKAEQLAVIPSLTVPRTALADLGWADSATRAYLLQGKERIYEIVHPITTRVQREREEIGLTLGGREQTIGWARVGMSLSLKRVNETIVGVQRTILLVTSLVIVLGVIVTVFLIKVIVRPVKQLALATRRLAEGERGFKVEIASKDEIGELAASFNQMAGALERREVELQDHADQLDRLNRQLVRQQQELREINLQLEAASRHKSQFLANMSHELRTPLNSIIGFADILLDESVGELAPEERKEFLGNILNSGRHLLRLINDILDLSKIEAGRMELHPELFALTEIVDSTLNTIKPLANQKQIAVEVATDPTLTRLVADPGKVKQVLFNLMSNAIKFTPEKGRVGLRVSRGSGEACFAVWDTGIGIKLEDQALLFEEFQQVESTAAKQYEGTGLGLALARKFVELHGGRIWVESEFGKGSTFAFALPLGAEAPAPSEARPEPEDRDRPLVLVVEDDPKTLDLLTFCLSRDGFRVDQARDGEEAVAKARALRPALITLDILLPKKGGMDVLKALKEDVLTRDIPVVVVSIVDERERGLSLGAADYILKPFDREDLVRRLERLGFAPHMQVGAAKILIVDDDPFAVEMLAHILEPLGFEVLRAFGGRQALELAVEEQPNLVVLDLLMPEVSGFEVAQRLRKDPRTQDIPVVVVTVKDLTDEERNMLHSLTVSVMPKVAFSKEEFLAEVGRVMRERVDRERGEGDGGRTNPRGGR